MKRCLFVFAVLSSISFYGQGEGGVFTSQRLASLRTGEGSLGNNPSALNWFDDLRNKTARLGMEQELTLDDIQGTVYDNEEFVKGYIYYRYKPYGEYPLRYDAFNDEVELKRGAGNEIEALFKIEAISCRVNNEKFNFTSFRNFTGELKKGYLITLFGGERYTLYERRTKIFKEGKPAKTSLQNSFPHRFLDEKTYFVAVGTELPFQIKTSKKDILSLAEVDEKGRLKDFLKQNTINVRDKKGLIQAIMYLDQL